MMENCSIEDPTNDDKILQCCLLFQRKGEEQGPYAMHSMYFDTYSVLHYVRKCIKVLNFIEIQVKVMDPAFYDMKSVPYHHGLATTHLTFLFSLADVGHSVLFSNDQNLCSKAIINGLKAFNHKVCLKSCLF